MNLTAEDLELLTPEERAAYEADPDGDNDALDAIEGRDPEDEDDGEGNAADKAPASDDEGDDDDKADPAPTGDAPADAQPEATEAKEEAEDVAPAAAARGPYAFSAPADIGDKLTALKTEEREAFKSLMDGEMTAEDYQAIKDRTDSERETLQAQKLKAELSAEMAQQQAERDWQNACNSFAAKVKAGEGIDYEANKVLGRALDAEMRELATNPDNATRPAEWFLAEAHKTVKAAMDLSAAAPAVPNKPTPPARPQRPAADTIPPSLSKLPAAAESATTDDKWAHLRNLPGDKLERAIAAMTEAQLADYINSEA